MKVEGATVPSVDNGVSRLDVAGVAIAVGINDAEDGAPDDADVVAAVG